MFFHREGVNFKKFLFKHETIRYLIAMIHVKVHKFECSFYLISSALVVVSMTGCRKFEEDDFRFLFGLRRASSR